MKKVMPFALAVCLLACKKTAVVQPASSCDAAISYSKTVQPIFIANCTASGCHDGADLPSLAEYYVAHDAAQQIRAAVASGVMPKNKTLSASDKSSITCWIDNGAKNN